MNMDEPAKENYMSLDESYSGNVSLINIDKNNKYDKPHGQLHVFFASCSHMAIMMMIWI